MPYRLSWSPDARNSLATLWIIASNRNAMTRAVYEIEQQLIANPAKGEAVSEGLYKSTAHPISLYYEIDHDKAHVRVTGIGLIHNQQ